MVGDKASERSASVRKGPGRDLKSAIAVGVGLGILALAALFIVRQIFIGIIALAVAIAMYELATALRQKTVDNNSTDSSGHNQGARVTLIPLLLGGQAIVWFSWPWGSAGLLTAFIVTTLVCLLWRIKDGVADFVQDVTTSIFVLTYVACFAAFAVLLVVPTDGSWRVLAFLSGVVLSDTGGYIAGVLFGKHAMAPAISPGKTWEGFVGSLVAGIIGEIAIISLALDGHWWQGAIFGIVIVFTATLGDLVESLIKRDLGLKDMGNLLPGHGGVMDRMDSLLPSAVVAWALLEVFGI